MEFLSETAKNFSNSNSSTLRFTQPPHSSSDLLESLQIEYENEVMRRIDLLQPMKDLERLKMMTEGTKEAVPVKKTPKKAKVSIFFSFFC